MDEGNSASNHPQLEVGSSMLCFDKVLLQHLVVMTLSVVTDILPVSTKDNRETQYDHWVHLMFYQSLFLQIKGLVTKFLLNPVLENNEIDRDFSPKFMPMISALTDDEDGQSVSANRTEIPCRHVLDVFFVLYHFHIKSL